MDTSKTPRKTVWEDIKGTLADGQEYWVYRDKPWRTWEEQKDKYAKFADGTVRTFAGFEHMESIEFTTENYLGELVGPGRSFRPMSLPHQIRRRTGIWLRVVGNERCAVTCAQMFGSASLAPFTVFGNLEPRAESESPD